MKSCVIYARSHCTIVYFDLGFLHFLEDTKTSISNDLKIRLIENWVFRVISFGLWLGILFFVCFWCVCGSLEVVGIMKMGNPTGGWGP